MKISTIVAAVAVMAMGCGAGQNPKKFVGSVAGFVAPASCYPTGFVVGSETQTNNTFSFSFSVWTSADGKTTVLTSSDLASLSGEVEFGAGGSNSNFLATLDDTFISTDGKTFAATGTGVNPQPSGSTLNVSDKITATITFADTSYTKGTVQYNATRSCSGDSCTDSAFENFTCDSGATSFISSQVSGTDTTFYNGN